jgi:hypothetical protein
MAMSLTNLRQMDLRAAGLLVGSVGNIVGILGTIFAGTLRSVIVGIL